MLNDPKQRRFFKAKDLNDLFTYTEENSNGTETGDIFAGMDVQEVKRTLKESEKEGSEGGEIDEREDNGSPKAGRMEEGEEAETKKGGDAAILKKLFDSDGLYSAIDHDHIMRAGETTIDLDIIQHEASRIAKQAAKELRNSRRERREQYAALLQPLHLFSQMLACLRINPTLHVSHGKQTLILCLGPQTLWGAAVARDERFSRYSCAH